MRIVVRVYYMSSIIFRKNEIVTFILLIFGRLLIDSYALCLFRECEGRTTSQDKLYKLSSPKLVV